jgi:hypothetical protein
MINTGAALRAGGIGVGLGFVVQLIFFGIGLATTGMAATAPDIGEDAAAGLLAGAGGLTMCLCCVGVLMYAGVGAAYAWFVEKDGGALEMGPIALGGAVSALASAFLSGICGALLGIVQSTMAGADIGTSITAAGLGLAFAICLYPLLYGGLGAAGGAIYAAIKNNQNKPQPAV